MNRIDRLTAILLFLQGGKRSAGEIAYRFEVSRRTILRDIQALCEIGIPIAAELGAAGGYTLPPDYFLPPLALTFHEALLLRLALGGLSQLGETSFKQERETLLAKIQTLIPQREHFEIDKFQQVISLTTPSGPYPTPFLDQLLECARTQQWASVTYRSEKGISQQTILPVYLRTLATLWYCRAYSYERQEKRVYRVDRFLDVRVTQPPPQAEPGLPAAPHGHPSLPEVRIQLTTRGVLILESEPHLGPLIQQRSAEGGWLYARCQPEEYAWLVRVVLSLGVEATVHAPESLRKRVQQEAQIIARHHAES